MSQNSKTPTSIKLAAKEASQRASAGQAADPGPGDPSAAPSEAPVMVDIPDPPSPSQLVVKSTNKGQSAATPIDGTGAPPEISGGPGADNAPPPSSGVPPSSGAPGSSAPGSGATGSASPDQPGDDEEEMAPPGASGAADPDAPTSGASPSTPGPGGPSSAGASPSSGAAGSSVLPDATGSAAPSSSAAAVTGSMAGSKSGITGLPAGPSSSKAGSQIGGSTSKSGAKSVALSSPVSASRQSSGMGKSSAASGLSSKSKPSASQHSTSKLPSSKHSTSKLSTSKTGAESPASSGLSRSPSIASPASSARSPSTTSISRSPSPMGAHGGKHGKKTTRFRYHKRVTVKTKGKTSPKAIMEKVNYKDHKAGITPSAIEDMDPKELMRRAGIKETKKGTHWRVRLRQTERITKNGKTITQTRVAYRDSEGHKKLKTSGTPHCEKCGKALEECKCK